jgi:hypothetical protein
VTGEPRPAHGDAGAAAVDGANAGKHDVLEGRKRSPVAVLHGAHDGALKGIQKKGRDCLGIEIAPHRVGRLRVTNAGSNRAIPCGQYDAEPVAHRAALVRHLGAHVADHAAAAVRVSAAPLAQTLEILVIDGRRGRVAQGRQGGLDQ